MPTDDELKEFGFDGAERSEVARRTDAPSMREIFAAQAEADKLYLTIDYTKLDAETAVKTYLAWAEIEELARGR